MADRHHSLWLWVLRSESFSTRVFLLKVVQVKFNSNRDRKTVCIFFVIWFPFPFGTQAPTCPAINRLWRLCCRILFYTNAPAAPTGIHKSLPKKKKKREKVNFLNRNRNTQNWAVERENFCHSISYHHIIIAMIMPPVLCAHISLQYSI